MYMCIYISLSLYIYIYIGVRMELDYHNEAGNADEFARKHAFLPFVSSPGWLPELTGPPGTARVLTLDWYSEAYKRDRIKKQNI